MRRVILILLLINMLYIAFSGETVCSENFSTFTDQDLEKYSNKPITDSGSIDQIRKENRLQLSHPLDASTVLKENNRTVVFVVALNKEDRPFSHGSGFIVSRDGVIVTSHHVISNAAAIKVKTDDNVLNVEGFVYKDKENDIAILKTKGKFLQAVKLGNSDRAEIGEKVYVMSRPRGTEIILSEGVFNGVSVFGSNRRMLQITANFSSGSSGGPVFNKSGEVIGIATSAITEAGNMNFAAPINLIKNNISSNRVTSLKDTNREDYQQSADYLLNLANNSNAAGKYADAVKAYKKALKINPNLSDAYNGLGIAYMNLKQYKESIEVYKKALRLDPDSALLHSNLGLVYSETGRYKEAVSELKHALRILPDLAAAHYNLGLAYRRLRMSREAINAYEQAIRINPDFPDAHYHLGITYVDLKDKDSALKEYKILKELDPSLADKLFNLIK